MDGCLNNLVPCAETEKRNSNTRMNVIIICFGCILIPLYILQLK
jgi:hypothetical protein